MIEEENGVAQQAAPTEEPQEPQPESESVPKPEEMSEEAKKAYEGKTPEEIAQMHYGLSKKLGEQGQVIGSLKDLVEEMRAGREKQTTAPNPFQSTFEQPREVAPPVSQQEQLADDDFLTYGKVKELFGQRDQTQQQQKYLDLTQKTSLAFEEGVKTMEGDPIFDGITAEVKQYMVNSYKTPFQYFGMDVSPELRSPKRWRAAAIQIRADRDEWDKIVPEKRNPMTAIQTETPSSVRTSPSDSTPVNINMNDRDMQIFMDEMENTTGKRPTKAEIEETVKRGGEVTYGDVSMSDINKGNR